MRPTVKPFVSSFSSVLIGLCVMAGGAARVVAGSDATTGASGGPLRFAISDKVVVGVSLGDARAALAIWAQELLKTAGLPMAPNQDWVKPSHQLLGAIRGGKVDMFCVTIQEYRRIPQYVDISRIITDENGGDQLMLVVRQDGGIVNLAGLKGRSLIAQESPFTSLAEPWLTVSLRQDGLESPGQWLGRMTTSTKLSQVVLPLFFGQADACVVARRGLNMMFELNPQLSRKLKVLRASPNMLSAFFAWRKDFPAHLKKSIIDRLLELRSSPTARQVLTLFQSPGFTAQEPDCLSTANSLLDAYERYLEPASGGKK